MPKRVRNSVVASFVSLVLLLVLALSLLYSRAVIHDIAQLQTSESDNLVWTLTQAEVEYLSFLNAMDRKDPDGQSDLKLVREKFDILYSRLATLGNSPVFGSLVQTNPDFFAALAQLQTLLDDAIPLIDGPDPDLQTGLGQMAEQSRDAWQTVRQLTTSGLGHFTVYADKRRLRIERTMRQLAVASASLLALLMALSLYLLLLNRQKSRRGLALEQANQRMNTILSTSLDGVLVADSHGRILEFNEAAERIFRCRSDDIKGRTVSELFVPDHRQGSHREGLRRLRSGGELQIVGKGRVKLEAKRADGEIFPIEMAVQSARDGDTEILITFVRDISKRVADEKELVKARDRALAGEKAKADFLTVMSHEIRTPLNGLLGNLSLLGNADLGREQRQFVHNMDVSGRILLRHVDSVLDIARFEAGKLQIAQERVHLGELLQNLVDGQGGNAANRGNTLDWTWVGAPLHWVRTDAQRIYQILLNLVGNAIKFTENGRISVEAEADTEPHGLDPEARIVEFRVSDTGIGIAEDQVTAIFDDFHTSDTSFGRAAGGAGLGLGIARRIVQAMGGDIGVESIPGEGSVFWVRIPMCPARAPAPMDPAPRRPPLLACLDVLVVEDNEINLQVARSMLKRDGHRVSSAQDGQSGVEMAESKRFDLIFMDVSMPVLDGLEATRRIRSGGGPSAKVPIIALSANVLPQDKERFRAAGMDAFLGKPLTLDALRRALGGVRANRDGPPDAGPDATPDAPDAPDDDPLVDPDQMAELRENLGQDAFDKLLGRFLDEADALVGDLTPGDAATAEPEALVGRVHRVAGSAAVFGAIAFRKLLNDVERSVDSGEIAALAALLPRLAPCWCATRARLST